MELDPLHLVRYSPCKQTNSYLSLWRSTLPGSRNTKWDSTYLLRRCSASPKLPKYSLGCTSLHPSLNPRSTHPSPTSPSLMPQMQQYNELNVLDMMEGILSKLKGNQLEWPWERGVTCLTRDNPWRCRRSTLTLSPRSSRKVYQQHHLTQTSQLCWHSSNSTHRISNS